MAVMTMKGLSKWTRGVWLTKTMTNDCHVIGTPKDIFVTRSIRRLPKSSSWSFLVNQSLPLGNTAAQVWGIAWYSKRVSQPFGVAIGMMSSLEIKMHLLQRLRSCTPLRMVKLQRFQLRRGAEQPNTAPKQPSASPCVFGDDYECEDAASKARCSCTSTSNGIDLHTSMTQNMMMLVQKPNVCPSQAIKMCHLAMWYLGLQSVAEDVLDDTPCEFCKVHQA